MLRRGFKPKEMADLANQWPINWTPSYREPTCAGCGRVVRKMFHIWFKCGHYFKEIHLCKRCGKIYGL